MWFYIFVVIRKEYSCEFRDVLIGFTKGSREVQRRLLSVRLYPLFIDTSLSTGFQVYLSKCWVPRMFTKALRYDSLEFLFNCSVNLMLSFVVVVVSLFSFVLLNHEKNGYVAPSTYIMNTLYKGE